MKILFFSTNYWPDIGGVAAHVYYLSRAIVEAEADVAVVCGRVSPISRSSKNREDQGFFARSQSSEKVHASFEA